MRATLIAVVGAALMVSACQKQDVSTPSSDAAEKIADVASWRSVATERDRDRLRGWYSSWQAALNDAKSKGEGANISAEGNLLSPSAALENPDLPAGEYRCRTLKIGTQGRNTLGFVAYDWFRCRVEDAEHGKLLIKLTGSQRPSGRIFADGYNRAIFLGTMALSDERTAIPYGSDRMRDMAGIVERIGDKQWRLVLPSPAFESLLDVMEIIPNS